MRLDWSVSMKRRLIVAMGLLIGATAMPVNSFAQG
jgi:hypothetical protein